MTEWLDACNTFLSILTSLMMDQYMAFIWVSLSWMAPWMQHLLDVLQEHGSDTDSDGISDAKSDDTDSDSWED